MTRATSKLFAIGLLAFARAAAASGGELRVCLSDWFYVQPNVLARAKFLSSRMFATAGVSIDWRRADSTACRAGDAISLTVNFSVDTPDDFHPNAMGYASPMEGVHVAILFDRIERAAADPKRLSAILAHVMTHEITHMIEGVSRHSETGLMKARWDARELASMALEPMPFAPEDLELIQLGMQRWNAAEM